MKFIATDEALGQLNAYGLTELEITREQKSRWKALHDGNIGDIVITWKNEDICVSPIGKNTALLFIYGQELNKGYEDLPEIKYINNEWIKK